MSLPAADRLERQLLVLAGCFLGVYSLALSISNAVRFRSWQVDYRWGHWIGLLIWIGIIYLAHQQLSHLLPERDPYLFPVAGLLSGWGLLTIWRLSSMLALRQTAWLVLIGMGFILALRYDCKQAGGRILSYLQRFKYIWLTSGLLLTAATLILGTNPLGTGPRLWLGGDGIYFQPSEPLKLLLIIYLAAYLADRQIGYTNSRKLLPLLTPTLLMTGLALLLLVFQRDLGTAAIFIVLYAVIVYAGTGNKNVLFASLIILVLAGVAGYTLFDVVNQRVEAWINPWLDPSGHSYQIVQSLLAVANGGLFGRGVGLGSPNVVPIAQSDFIFSAISEECGLLGAVGILGLLALLVNRGMRIAMKAEVTFQRLLAIGLVVHLVGQSLLIIAGNLRLLPLTGVTLPFVSNGGSSLLVSYFELLCLILISARQEEAHAYQPEALKIQSKINLLLSGGLMLGLVGAALTAGWWSLVRGSNLLSRTDNPRRSIADRYVLRGSILDRSESPVAESSGQPGNIARNYPYPALGPLVGYTDPVYGQAGLEASLDAYLRGLQGYPTLTMSWEQLLYGEPPPGLDVRLSLDLDLQAKADQLLSAHQGALVLLNASSGEILAMASSPTFDANSVEADWERLVTDPRSPLFNRATMGMYPAGNALDVFLLAASHQVASSPFEATEPADCAIIPANTTWAGVVAAGCTEPTSRLAASTSTQDLINLIDGLGLFSAPSFPVETLSSTKPTAITDPVTYLSGVDADPVSGAQLHISPLQMALAAASLSNGGKRVLPRLAMAVENPGGGWVMLLVKGLAQQALKEQSAINVTEALAIADLPVWQVVSNVKQADNMQAKNEVKGGYTWYLGGTLPEWKGATIAIAVLLEEDNPQEALRIGHSIFQSALRP
jgi:cell division protein FtsW (lipid II flippase)